MIMDVIYLSIVIVFFAATFGLLKLCKMLEHTRGGDAG